MNIAIKSYMYQNTQVNPAQVVNKLCLPCLFLVCRNKFGTSCQQLVTSLTTLSDLLHDTVMINKIGSKLTTQGYITVLLYHNCNSRVGKALQQV